MSLKFFSLLRKMSLEEIAAAVAITSKRRKERKKRKTREHWVKTWRRRKSMHKKCLRMTPGCFDELFKLAKDDIRKKHKFARYNIEA